MKKFQLNKLNERIDTEINFNEKVKTYDIFLVKKFIAGFISNRHPIEMNKA